MAEFVTPECVETDGQTRHQLVALPGPRPELAMFTLSTADDRVIHDPSPEVIAAVIEGLPAGGDAFAILASDADELTFIQAIGSPAEGFALEYQD